LFWLRGDAAFANPDIYEYCEEKRGTCFGEAGGTALKLLFRSVPQISSHPLIVKEKN
jgi:hypothetical protein